MTFHDRAGSNGETLFHTGCAVGGRCLEDQITSEIDTISPLAFQREVVENGLSTRQTSGIKP